MHQASKDCNIQKLYSTIFHPAVSKLTDHIPCLVAQSCLILCDPMDCRPPGFSVHGILHKNTGVGRHFLLQGIFPSQGSNSGLLHGR